MSYNAPMKESNWFERQFEFNHPIEILPAVVERVRGTPARLQEIVASYPPALLTRRPEGEDWSIQEHVGHLYDLDELHDGRLNDYAVNLDMLRAADLDNKKTYAANHNDASIHDLLARFRAVRTQFVARIEALDEAAVARSAMHPRLQKPMRVIDLAVFVAEHDDHHLASITRLARTLGR